MAARKKRRRIPLSQCAPLSIAISAFAYPSGARAVRLIAECDQLPPSINDITNMVPMERAAHAKWWRSQYAVAVAASGHELAPPVIAEATFTWNKARRRDLWNYSPKWAIDGIVEGGLIPDDDSDRIVGCTTRFAYTKGERPRLEILLRQVEPTEWVVIR